MKRVYSVQAAQRKERDRARKALKRAEKKAKGDTQEADASQVRMSQLREKRRADGNTQEADASQVRMSQLREKRRANGDTQEADAKREARARAAALDLPPTAINLLDEFYANTTSRVNANSRLLDDKVGTPEVTHPCCVFTMLFLTSPTPLLPAV